MEKQKNKAKNTPDRLPVLKFFLYGFLVFVVVIIILIILGPSLGGTPQIHQISLPEELRPTAEYVFEHVTNDERQRLTEHISIQIDTIGYGENRICLNAGFVPDEPDYPQHSRVFVNGEHVRGAINSILLDGFDGHERMNLCVEGDLEPGLHLIEFHLRDSFFGAPLAIQQWAIEVE